MAKTFADRVKSSIDKTSTIQCFTAREDIHARVDRVTSGAAGYRPLEVAGIARSLHSYLEQSLLVPEPIWGDVRAFHAAWVAANEWSAEISKTSRGPTKEEPK